MSDKWKKKLISLKQKYNRKEKRLGGRDNENDMKRRSCIAESSIEKDKDKNN